MPHTPRHTRRRFALAGVGLLASACLLWVLVDSLRGSAAESSTAAAGSPAAARDVSETAATTGSSNSPTPRESERFTPGPWSVDAGTAAGPQSSAEALTSGLSLLVSTGLLNDLPEVLRQLSIVQPLGVDSPIDDAFVEMIQERSPSSFMEFQELVLDDLSERTLARERGESPPPLDPDSARQLALRLVIAAELGRTGGQLTGQQSDEVMARSFDALIDPSMNQPDLTEVLYRMVERRVGDEPSADERAMVSLTAEQARGLTAPQRQRREMLKALLARAAEAAARRGRRSDFDVYSRRFLSIRMGDSQEQSTNWQLADMAEIARLRQLMGDDGRP